MIAARYAPILFSMILSGFMSLLVSGISTFRAIGPAADFLSLWGGAWLTAWAVTFPVVLLVATLTSKAVQRMIAER